MAEPHFFNPSQAVEVRTNRLPHWQQEGGIYFVTFRLADSVPAEALREWERDRAAWLKRHPPPQTPESEIEYRRLFPAVLERWLDAGKGSCALREQAAADMVVGALRFYEGRHCEMFSFVVMPNHVHALFGLLGDTAIDGLIKAWKGYVSHALRRRPIGQWPGWQKDYFDRLVRGPEHFERCVRYIRNNPRRAGLKAGEFVLWENERATAVL